MRFFPSQCYSHNQCIEMDEHALCVSNVCDCENGYQRELIYWKYVCRPVFCFTNGLWCESEEGGANSLLRTWLHVRICVVEEAWSSCVLVRSAKGSRTLQSLESSSASCG
ncbi:hypothetical protein HPB49_006590 [Dermacentor silvarum]|uniref:Uncharacterized protein n=1 Tax=Dermacentor silvarum TaxID=543639 RepID=A0ACB8CDL6_DERSI|nr:hypothetical protein HPB49_006590 [Dermacentor silvarum]